MSGDNGHEIAPFGQSVDQRGLASDMTGFNKKIGDEEGKHVGLRYTFLTLTNFRNDKQAKDYADGINKAIKEELWHIARRLIMHCMAFVSVDGKGREQLVDILTQIQIMEDRAKNDDRKSARKPQQVNA